LHISKNIAGIAQSLLSICWTNSDKALQGCFSKKVYFWPSSVWYVSVLRILYAVLGTAAELFMDVLICLVTGQHQGPCWVWFNSALWFPAEFCRQSDNRYIYNT